MVLISKHRNHVPLHERKRHGQHHHKDNRSYVKTYWPYLPMLLLVVGGLLLNTTWNTTRAVLGYATNISGVSLLQDTNTARSQNGLGALALNNQLAAAAQAKANDMVTRDYWSHTSPDGVQPWQFISNAGYSFSTAGENLAYGFDTSSDTVTGWMNSAGHRANVLSLSYKDVGFGIANAPNFQGTGEETIVVAMYGAPVATSSPVAAVKKTSTPTPAPSPSTNSESESQPAPSTNDEPKADTSKTADVASSSESSSLDVNNGQVLASKQLARIDLLTSGNSAWISLAISSIAAVGAISLVLRHGRSWKRVWVEEKAFVIHHPFLDILVVGIVTFTLFVSHTAGFIH